MTTLQWGAATDVGRVRANNEDSSLVADHLFAVADGMGGHRAGEVASQVAVAALRANYTDRSVEGLKAAVEQANHTVFQQQAEDPDLRGMGTTLVAVSLVDGENGEELAFVNVGDSRIYRLHDGELEQITEDHTVVDELVRDGLLSPEEATTHPQRHIITRALGIDAFVRVDADSVVPYTGDRFLLCSDGLFDEVEDNRIAGVLRRLSDPSEAAAELVRLALQSGGRDNVTVVVVDVVDDDDRAGTASAALADDPKGTVADMAGFTTAPAEEDEKTAAVPAATSRRARATEKEKAPRPRRFTWRVALFALAFLVVLGAAAGAVGWYARNTYYVGFLGDEVAIFRGRPGGVLWFDPTLEQRTGIDRADVPSRLLPRLEDGKQEGSLGDAEAYVKNLREEIDPPTSPTSTTSSTTSTTRPTTSSSTSTTVAAPN